MKPLEHETSSEVSVDVEVLQQQHSATNGHVRSDSVANGHVRLDLQDPSITKVNGKYVPHTPETFNAAVAFSSLALPIVLLC